MTDKEALRDVLTTGEELTIVCHNNPDPDCLASALALGRIAAKVGIDERRILYSGDISHQQNRAFINLLDIDLSELEPEQVRNRQDDSLLAFVDHATPGANNRVPEGTRVDIVIDHHPAEGIEARFVDHREAIGATSTILTQYVTAFDVGLDETLATALLFAIRRETLSFLRGVTPDEYAAAGSLHNTADLDLLRELSSPSVTDATVDAIGHAIENRTVRGATLLTHVGRTRERDALPQAADYLATLEGVETAVVFGIVGESIHISARSTDSKVNIGNVLDDAFGDVGSAGGHQEMAGGEIPLGIFADYTEDDAELVAIVERIITERLVEGLHLRTDDDSQEASSTAE